MKYDTLLIIYDLPLYSETLVLKLEWSLHAKFKFPSSCSTKVTVWIDAGRQRDGKTNRQRHTLTGTHNWKCYLSVVIHSYTRFRFKSRLWLHCQFCLFFCLIFGGHQSFWWGHWYPCFVLLVSSGLGFKARVCPLLACFVTCMQQYPQIHLWCDTCQSLGSQHGSWAILIHILVSKHWWSSNLGSIWAASFFFQFLVSQDKISKSEVIIWWIISLLTYIKT